MRVMYDSTNPRGMPNDGDIYAGYVDGADVTFPSLHEDFPHAKALVSITATGNLSAVVADCERFDLSPESAARWAREEHGAGRMPSIYVQESNWQTVKDAVHAEGLDPSTDVQWWVAWWGHDGIPDGAVACQVENTPNYDKSLVRDYWPGVDPEPSDHPTHEPTSPTAHPGATTEAIVPNLPTLAHGAGTHTPNQAVRRVQGLLIADGHDLHTDGIFGDQTDAAVRTTQRDNGIADDGIVGPHTWTVLLTGKP